MPGDRIAGILLAAGAASRFGGGKLAATLNGEPLLIRSAAAMLGAGLDPVVVVVAPGFGLAVQDQVTMVVNARWRTGVASSVQAGLTALRDERGVCAAAIAPADQPWCGAEVYRRLVCTFREARPPVTVATYAGAIRNPVVLARSQWGLADRLHGDVGLSAVVRSLSPIRVECGDVGSVADIDTREDLGRTRRSEEARRRHRHSSTAATVAPLTVANPAQPGGTGTAAPGNPPAT